ncbi:alpha-hydroxy acid oxidase [Ramlibacter humi]|uniref:Alpha-hydroxy-acid oxidizing protein n=1 Tax=Ramlibacter humi TaxID=2530451 RepID=A0A4Z0CDR1_9BURK|nr:alpha-hydroxy acid oxidase [Ramlibacter humi]TFZ08630.1 alpha-hydroxy-acid oxidizing protein [Ramlibacter humi]
MDIQPLPTDLASLADHERHARAALDPAAWSYLCGAAGDGLTERNNRAAWESIALRPRVLAPLAGLNTRTTLLGRSMAWPLLVAPVAFQQLAHRDGELGIAMAAAAQEAGMVLSTQAGVAMEAVAEAVREDAGRGPLWFQLYWQADRGIVEGLVRRAEACGFEALVLTVDSPVRAGFRLPAGLATPNLPPSSGDADFDTLCATAPTWAELEWLCGRTRLPVVVKGVLHHADAREAVARGAAAVIVSNHGGRTLDGAVATATVLPGVVEAVGGRAPVLVDGGLRRGADILKALALGAQAVLVGRPAVWGLAHSGAIGVAHALRLLRDELQMAMALCGCADLARVRAEPPVFSPNQ